MKNRFTVPKVKSYPLESGKDWYVWFRFNNGNPIRVKEGINKISDFDERIEEAQALAEVLHEKLQKGWIPPTRKKALPQPENLNYNIIEAFDVAFKEFKDKKAEKTYADYSSIYRKIKPAIIKLDWHKYDIKEFESYHIKMILDATKKNENWSNKRFNTASNVMRSIFTTLKKKFIVKINHAQGLEYLEEEESEIIDLITDQEQTEIINHFNKVCPRFNIFLKLIYQVGIRPGEIRDIKCSMVDFKKNLLLLPKEITKNGKIGRVPLTEDLKSDLASLDMSNPDFYIFGIESPYCRRKEKLFLPSAHQISKNVAGNIWRDNVHSILNIYKKMYWFKHKGANDKEDIGMDLDVVKEIFRHSSENVTKIYATKHQDRVFEKARKMIPEFK
ncbi:site-specific integrase [Soonwooa sp.]|uniref:site-specific integrase n=1 Tax=Soonwooa sp. TaxID=1938592 RepID=UPI0028AFE8F7|nr:site-specific integrase [Soonwooa sp.]